MSNIKSKFTISNSSLHKRLLKASESLSSAFLETVTEKCIVSEPIENLKERIDNIISDAISLLVSDEWDSDRAIAIGKNIFNFNLKHAEKLAGLQNVFFSYLPQELSTQELLLVYPRIYQLIVEIVAGFVSSSEEKLLLDQARIRQNIEKARNEAEFARHQIETRHNVIVENIPEIIIIIDIQGNVIYFHPGKRERNQFSINMEGINIKSYIPDGLYEEFKIASKKALSTGEKQFITTTFPFLDKIRIFEGRIAPYTEDKTITIVRDITEIVDYQNALKASQANLQEMTRQIIDIQESERHQIALDLHDQVLSQLGALFLFVDESSLPPKFIENYHKLVDQIRSTIYNLRPPMLNYGLYPALDDLYSYLSNHQQSNIPVEFNVTPSKIRVDPNIELHLFRIIQEATSNACKHSEANRILISGKIHENYIWFKVEDDGIGLQCCENTDLTKALLNNHFGIAGMFERAVLIGAEISITSNPNEGTTVAISWKPTTD